jgi:hypothetical protein
MVRAQHRAQGVIMEPGVRPSDPRFEMGVKHLQERMARHSRSYRCRCASRVFFRNTQCLACQSQLGYLPDERRVAALDPAAAPGTWRDEGRDPRDRPLLRGPSRLEHALARAFSPALRGTSARATPRDSSATTSRDRRPTGRART